MFLQVSVHKGGGVHLPRQTPLGRHPPLGQTPPPRQTPPLDRHPPLRRDGHCSGRYVTHWNAFLLNVCTFNSILFDGVKDRSEIYAYRTQGGEGRGKVGTFLFTQKKNCYSVKLPFDSISKFIHLCNLFWKHSGTSCLETVWNIRRQPFEVPFFLRFHLC